MGELRFAQSNVMGGDYVCASVLFPQVAGNTFKFCIELKLFILIRKLKHNYINEHDQQHVQHHSM